MRRLLASLLVATAAAAGLASCGGDDDEAKALITRAFDKPIGSAVVTADVEVRIEGVQELSEPIRLRVTGPYRSGEDNTLPAFDWDVSFSGGDQTLTGGLVSTTDNFFVIFNEVAYESGEDAVRRANEQLAAEREGREERSLSQFGVDPAEWLGDASEEGDEDVAGVPTTRVQAKVDVARMLDDLNTLIDRAGNVAGPAPPKLTDEQKEQVADVVDNPVLDVYVGKEDEIIRRLSANIAFDVPEDSRDDVGGIEGGRISFSVQFADVGSQVRIEAPDDARPLAELAQQLGGLGGGGAEQQGGAPPEAGAPEQGAPPQDGAGAGGDPFSRYSQCLREADPSDLTAIEACSALLQ